MTLPQPDFDDSNDSDFPFDLHFEEEEEEVEEENEEKWPAGPSRMPTEPLPGPTAPTWNGNRHWFDHEHRHEARERQAALRRQEVALQQQLGRLEAQESAISAQWATLPSPSSPVRRMLIALAVLGSIVLLLHFFPILLVPFVVVFLTMVKTRRYQRVSRQRNVWARQERDRLESRWNGIVAERAVIEQQLASIQRELNRLAP